MRSNLIRLSVLNKPVLVLRGARAHLNNVVLAVGQLSRNVAQVRPVVSVVRTSSTLSLAEDPDLAMVPTRVWV